jgi:DNA-binding TFAR19-related protein (PDSD5 family)
MNPQEEMQNNIEGPVSGMEETQTGEGQGVLSQEEMKANLDSLMAKINSKYREFGEQVGITKSMTKEQKELALQELFDLFRAMGIDPSDEEQVREFLDKIKLSNPELYQQIEKALTELVDEDEDEEGIEEEDIEEEGENEMLEGDQTFEGGNPLENMNIDQNEDIQQNI